MKNLKIKQLLLFLLPLVLFVGLVVKLKKNKAVATEKVYQFDKKAAIKVATQKVVITALDGQLAYTGTFEPNRESKLSAEVQGKINSVFVDAGSYVKQGQPLIKLDDALLRQQLKTSDVLVQNLTAETEIQLQTNAVQLEGLEADVKRFRTLAASDAIQGVQLEKADIQLRNAQNQRRVLQQQSGIKNAEAQKAILLEQLKKTTITAPFGGVITAKFSEIGSFAGPGMPLLQLTELNRLKFTINVPETDINNFVVGQTYSIIPEAYSASRFEGKVLMIGSKANVGNSFPVQLLVYNTPDFKIKSGMLGRVTKNKANGRKGIVIPASALQGSADAPEVYINKNGKAVLQLVKISERMDSRVVIESGLAVGDEIITSGFTNLFVGATISKIN